MPLLLAVMPLLVATILICGVRDAVCMCSL